MEKVKKITALEAKQISDKIKEEKGLNEIFNCISCNVGLGLSSCNIRKDLNFDQVQELMSLGYKVSTYNDPIVFETFYKISW